MPTRQVLSLQPCISLAVPRAAVPFQLSRFRDSSPCAQPPRPGDRPHWTCIYETGQLRRKKIYRHTVSVIITYLFDVSWSFCSAFSSCSSRIWTRFCSERSSWPFAICSASSCLTCCSSSSARALAASASARSEESFWQNRLSWCVALRT